jgi:hypothetical protein
VLNYTLFCLAALFLMVVCLAERGLDWWCLVPSLIGGLTLLTNWNHGPPMVLLSLAGLLGMTSPRTRGNNWPGWSHRQTPTLMDVLLCFAVLAYVLGHYRLLSLMRHIFPPDPRRPKPERDEGTLRSKEKDRMLDSSSKRSPDLVDGWEMALLGCALPVWVGLAVSVWARVLGSAIWGETPLGVPLAMWRALQIVWASLAVLAAAGTVAGYVRWRSATPDESLLYLQDQLWRQTRREQSSLNRWLTWARLRAQRKKETL